MFNIKDMILFEVCLELKLCYLSSKLVNLASNNAGLSKHF